LALLIILAALVIGKALYWFFGNVVKALTKKTKTKLDDIIIDMVEEPLVFTITLLGVWYGLRTLTFGETFQKWLGIIFQVLIVINVAWLISRLFDSILKQYLMPLTEKSETDLDDQLLPLVRKGTKAIIWIIAIIVALNNAGYEVGPLIAGLGIGGIAFAMAAKDTISNIFGGFTIFTDKPFMVRDRVKIEGFDGSIKEIGLRSTRLETLDGRIVTIPNSTFTDSPVENVSSEPSRKIVLNLGLTYDTTPEQMQKALNILKEIAEKNKDIEEKVSIAFNGFGDFAMNVLFIYYIKKESDILDTQTNMNLEILNSFNKNKLEFAFPTQTIFTKQV